MKAPRAARTAARGAHFVDGVAVGPEPKRLPCFVTGDEPSGRLPWDGRSTSPSPGGDRQPLPIRGVANLPARPRDAGGQARGDGYRIRKARQIEGPCGACPRRSISPKQIGGSPVPAEVGRTGAR
jgi:hypothetical protein